MTGKIKSLREGYGFIKSDSGGGDVFFHMSDMKVGSFQDLTEGMSLEYDVKQSPKGPRGSITRIME